MDIDTHEYAALILHSKCKNCGKEVHHAINIFDNDSSILNKRSLFNYDFFTVLHRCEPQSDTMYFCEQIAVYNPTEHPELVDITKEEIRDGIHKEFCITKSMKTIAKNFKLGITHEIDSEE